MSRDVNPLNTADPRQKRPQAAEGSSRTEENLLTAIATETGIDDFTVKKARRIEGHVPAESIHAFAAAMYSRVGFEHLSAISCVDWIHDGEFELVYHFWSYRDSCLVSAKTRIDRETATITTITDLWQPASFFERDIHEMFGVVFSGNTDLEKYILTDWNGPPPMRKDFVTRQFAHEHFHYKDYEPDWDELVEGGYHSNRGKGIPGSTATPAGRSGEQQPQAATSPGRSGEQLPQAATSPGRSGEQQPQGDAETGGTNE